MVLVPQVGGLKSDGDPQISGPGASRQQSHHGAGAIGLAVCRQGAGTFDAGYYKLAEQCALAIAESEPQSDAALLLRGHVLDSLHRFHEAETLARQLVARRGQGFDYGLLGDALMEQGRLTEAVAAYQHMMSLRPDLHAYARAAHVRWLTGDLDGAIEAMGLAVSAARRTIQNPPRGSTRGWRITSFRRVARPPRGVCGLALSLQTNYPPALLLRGKMLLTEGNSTEAVKFLRMAAQFVRCRNMSGHWPTPCTKLASKRGLSR